MNTTKPSLDSMAAATVLAMGILVASAGGFADAPAPAGAKAQGAEFSLTQAGTMKMTVTAERGHDTDARRDRTARTTVHNSQVRS